MQAQQTTTIQAPSIGIRTGPPQHRPKTGRSSPEPNTNFKR